MLSLSLFALVFALISPLSKGQDIDLSAVLAAASPVLVTPPLDVASSTPTLLATTSAAAVPTDTSISPRDLLPRDACSTQPPGVGPVPTPDTVQAFLTDTTLQSMALNAPTPNYFTKAFTNLNASVTASNYIGVYTLSSYNTSACASICSSVNGCIAFNTYVERDPSSNVRCPNVPSSVYYRCTVWGAPIVSSQATNTGQWRNTFQVAITASNGYNIEFADSQVPNYQSPVSFGNASINAPPGSYMGSQYFPFSQSQGYSAQTCASYCDAQTAYNAAHPNSDCSYTPCNFFNAYVLSKNGAPQGLYCAIYNSSWPASYATTSSSSDQQGNEYTVSQSYGYTHTNPPSFPAYAAGCTPPPILQDGDFDSPKASTSYPYLSPFWNATIWESAGANGCLKPGYNNSPCAFGASIYGRGYPEVILTQTIAPLIAQKIYTLSFYYKFDSGMQNCWIENYGPGGSYVSGGGLASNTWYSTSSTFTATGKEKTATFYFGCDDYYAEGDYIYMDSVTIQST